jgi:protein-S-isoprenylcysteine O-methyltransferase Ste14
MTGRGLGRLYFGLQALAGAAWWVGVFTIPFVRDATLGDLPPVPVAVADIPLFVVASALVAAGVRSAVWVVVPWTLLVTAGLTVYATVTTEAGWGAVLMAAAAAGGVGAGMLVLFGRLPTERLLIGPLGFRNARPAPARRHVARTALQIVVFWGLFLGVIPVVLAWLEHRWQLHVPFPFVVVAVGIAVFALASALGLWSAFAMTTRGAGTPLPSDATTRLVATGPYRFVRNPMAMAGIVQGAAVGLALPSWIVVVYAIAGSAVWNYVVRPVEERDLLAKFGAPYAEYCARVRCWVPRIPARTVGA